MEDTASVQNELNADEESDTASVKTVEAMLPSVNETAYIPYDYARAMIMRIVEDMNKMKTNHLAIIAKMEVEYQKMEDHTQVNNEPENMLFDGMMKKKAFSDKPLLLRRVKWRFILKVRFLIAGSVGDFSTYNLGLTSILT